MLAKETEARIVLTTTSTFEDARVLGRRLVEERLAACATIIPGAESIYHWDGAIAETSEVVILLKTFADRLESLELRLNELHPYETAEFLVLKIASCGNKYVHWLRETLGHELL